jgi:hypothetical protein
LGSRPRGPARKSPICSIPTAEGGMNSPFRKFGAAICRDQPGEKLRLALAPYTFDGSECFSVINSELRGRENETARSNIRHAVLSQYRDVATIDVVVEVVGKLHEDGALS